MIKGIPMNSGCLSFRMFLIAITLIIVLAPCRAADLSDLKSVESWQNIAPGIWRASLGNIQGELRYTQFAAAPPKLDALNELSKPNFPFMPSEITYLVTPDNKIMIRIPTGADEKLYGFGLQLDGIEKSRKVMTLNMDHWSKGGGRTHAPVPFYVSSKGYGIFFNTARFLKIYNQVGNRKDSPHNPPEVDRNPPRDEKQAGPWQALPPGDAVEAQINGKGLEVIIFSGNSMLDVVCRYNLYNGGGALPYPCTFEWQKKRFPDPAKFARELLNKGIRLNLWENPYISKHSRIYEKMYPLSGSHMVWLGIVPDYTLPKARQLLTDQHYQDHIRIGISGYKIDEVDGYDFWLWPDHATFPSGVSGEAMRQSYGLLMQNMLYNDLFKKNNVRTYGLVRASNGAASGYPFVIYSDSYNHEQYITGLSTASLSGILWTPEARSARTGREWLNRMQTVCFSPMAQLNAWSSGKKPWSYGEVTDSVRDVIKLRMRLLPYLYSAFADYHFKGIPPIRAMILEDGFSELEAKVIEGKLDSETNPYARGKIIEKTDQFMFGPSIMVAPFYESQSVTRQVQLPAGNWYEFYSGKFVGNNKTITVTAKDMGNRIPLFVKEGAVIPILTKAVNQTDKAYGHPLEVRYYGKTNGSFTLYEDDGKTFNYEKGQHRTRHLAVSKDQTGQYKLTERITKKDGPVMFGSIEKFRIMTK